MRPGWHAQSVLLSLFHHSPYHNAPPVSPKLPCLFFTRLPLLPGRFFPSSFSEIPSLPSRLRAAFRVFLFLAPYCLRALSIPCYCALSRSLWVQLPHESVISTWVRIFGGSTQHCSFTSKNKKKEKALKK